MSQTLTVLKQTRGSSAKQQNDEDQVQDRISSGRSNSNNRVKLQAVLFSQCAKKTYIDYDSNRGYETERRPLTVQSEENREKLCACDWEVKRKNMKTS